MSTLTARRAISRENRRDINVQDGEGLVPIDVLNGIKALSRCIRGRLILKAVFNKRRFATLAARRGYGLRIYTSDVEGFVGGLGDLAEGRGARKKVYGGRSSNSRTAFIKEDGLLVWNGAVAVSALFVYYSNVSSLDESVDSGPGLQGQDVH